MVSKRYVTFKNFGKCLELSNGEIKALITVDVGPRIIFYGYKGYNLLFEDVNRHMHMGGEFFDCNFKKGEKWYLYGGHRLWKAKEDIGSYVPDNYPIKVDKTKNGAIFTPRLQELTKLQLKMEIEMDINGKLKIIESFENTDDNPQTVATWGITAMRPNGKEIIPLNQADTGFLPNQNLVFWPYSDIKDKRFNFSNKYAILKHKKDINDAFKLGLYNHYGWAGYAVGKYFYVRRFDAIDGNLPDFYCNYETYVNEHYLEIEVVSPLVTLSKGESVKMTEYFEVYKDIKFENFSDSVIDNVIKSIL